MARVAKLPCCICKAPPPSTVHHVRHSIHRTGTMKRDHRRVVPLCPKNHFAGSGESVEDMHEAGIYERYGIDLLALADRLWRESDGMEGKR